MGGAGTAAPTTKPMGPACDRVGHRRRFPDCADPGRIVLQSGLRQSKRDRLDEDDVPSRLKLRLVSLSP
jgi:hypothetical protein